jgi:hypothetical protein
VYLRKEWTSGSGHSIQANFGDGYVLVAEKYFPQRLEDLRRPESTADVQRWETLLDVFLNLKAT